MKLFERSSHVALEPMGMRVFVQAGFGKSLKGIERPEMERPQIVTELGKKKVRDTQSVGATAAELSIVTLDAVELESEESFAEKIATVGVLVIDVPKGVKRPDKCGAAAG